MKTIDVTRQFSTEDQCLDYLEKSRWPHGVCCVHCGVLNVSRITREKKGKNQRTRIYQCLEKECGKQFSATSGTIFNDTHLPLIKWFLAIALICEAKKGMSACQLQRHLGVNYRTAWYLAHRIREAMQDGSGLLTGVVEADETYLSPKKPRKGFPKPKKQNPDVVLGMIERGGKLRFIPITDAKMASIEPHILKNVSPDALLQTDMSFVYSIIGQRKFPGQHRMIDH
ncbi:MAG TPA: IS1595 family transposase, partial [Candidatus Acidoferrum sp.]|nr:IS1595 family transposase [Candidatus Acidoferrum sp.]